MYYIRHTRFAYVTRTHDRRQSRSHLSSRERAMAFVALKLRALLLQRTVGGVKEPHCISGARLPARNTRRPLMSH